MVICDKCGVDHQNTEAFWNTVKEFGDILDLCGECYDQYQEVEKEAKEASNICYNEFVGDWFNEG